HGERIGENQRDKRASTKLKKQKFNRQQDTGNRRVEHRRQSGARAAGEQDFSLRCGGGNNLADQRTKRAASLDDRTFRAERTSRADGNGGGEWFQDRYFRFHTALRDEHSLHRFGNAVSSYF